MSLPGPVLKVGPNNISAFSDHSFSMPQISRMDFFTSGIYSRDGVANFLSFTAIICTLALLCLFCFRNRNRRQILFLSENRDGLSQSRALLALAMLSLMLVAKVLLQRGKLAANAMEVEILLRGQCLFS
jgi:preprotein translocase subunit SecG